jgi:heptaprenyl diphosphate synthase
MLPFLDAPRRILSMAVFAALAIVLHRMEALLPLPSPWIKLGLANIMTLLALIYMGFKEAFIVTIVRVIGGSILAGTFMSPTFFLSSAGALTATLVMAAFYVKGRGPFSLVGICVASAYAHTATTFLCVYAFLGPMPGFLKLIPLFSFIALAGGVLTGLIANGLSQRLDGEGMALEMDGN